MASGFFPVHSRPLHRENVAGTAVLPGMAAVQGLTREYAARDAARRMDTTSRRSEKAQRDHFDRLTARHRGTLLAVAKRYCCHRREVADDLVQETYLRAWRRFDALQDEARVLSWLVTILHNCWIDECRRAVRSKVQSMAEVPEQPHTVDEPSPWQRITVDDVYRAIEQLPEPFRSVAILHDVDQLSNADIARRLALPYGTVASRLHRARKQLLELLRVVLDGAVED